VEPDETECLKIATWNILADHIDLPERLDAIAKELAEADVVLLQEVLGLPERGTTTAHLIASLSGMQVVSIRLEPVDNASGRHHTGTAVLARLPALEVFSIPVAAGPPPRFGSIEFAGYAAARLDLGGGRDLLVTSLHLPWGAEREHRRLAHLLEVKQFFDDTANNNTLCVIGGDFNTFEDSDTVRFLTGRHIVEGEPTFWVDVWPVSGDGSPGYTQDPKAGNYLIDRVARGVGLDDASLMPARRIDYLMARGWVYGRIGSPVVTKLIGNTKNEKGKYPSDHYGVMTSLWVPAKD